MTHKRAFFHDRLILLLLTVNAFLVALCIATIMLRLGDTSESYIGQYRANLGLDAYKVSGLGEILSFIPFVVIVYSFQLFVGMRMYGIRKSVSHIILLLTTLLLLLALLASYSLLSIR